ncbi:diguanylate cyclase [Motilimonas eburnea]|uniref:diguanylate cyclase n=1 Tax=Motilimonas eburnea TaxID=1737488 RepID=UPI001E3052C5|nr:diguanylate cyclase [Motilimonas eburnea]MCE2573473.1 diguanylate cyclase [Motilimonas eburnea]
MDLKGYTDIELVHLAQQSRVYRAVREVDQVQVMLKTPNQDFPDPRQLSALKREHSILQTLSGDGLAQAFDYIEQKNSAVLVRQWLEGISLRQYEKENSPSLTQALNIAIQLTDILGCVHQQHYCHRDISAGNVIVDPATEKVSLIDFCSALELPNRARQVIKPKFIEGSRPYMSPEQTGRMNRGLDFRTDFYSLGVLFYELFTQRLPFAASDNNELIHCHIAVEPAFPDTVNPDIPHPLARLIIKLMSKSPDDRYQSAQGLAADLRHCLAQWQQHQRIDDFVLAQHEVQDWFILPDKLYGREQQTAQLLNTFDRVSEGKGHLVFISGPAGIGKTSLIRELYRPLAGKGGYIVSGKYDQVMRHQPYSALLQALTSLVRQLLAEPAALIEYWRDKIQQGVGVNGQVIIEVIPELALLLGPQPKLATLSVEAASTRFNTTFHNLMHSLGHTRYPLVIFIDDLQWIDPPSLALLEAMAPALADSSLMMIAAYRDNEVDQTHPLSLSMPNLTASCPHVLSIALGELDEPAFVALVQDCVALPHAELAPFVALLRQRAQGNPLIFRTMLASLHHQGHLYYDYETNTWGCLLKEVEKLPTMHNSLEMLRAYILQLPEATSSLLRLASCIGNTFDLHLLVSLSGLPRSKVATLLLPCVSVGLILPLDDDFELLTTQAGEQLPDVAFRFSHDRVQQAAYTCLSEQQTIQAHWQIGWQMLQDSHEGETLFDAVEHLNQGCALANDVERDRLVELNIQAAAKAKASAAFSVAYNCLSQAHALLIPLAEPEHSERTIDLEIQLAQACYLVGEFEQAQDLYQALDAKNTSVAARLKLCNIRAKQYHHQGLYQASVAQERAALALLGIDLPDDDDALLAMFAEQQQQINALLQRKDAERLYQQAEVDEAHFVLTHELLFDLFVDSYLLGRAPLLSVAAAISARISMEQGNCCVTSAGYINYATILCSSGHYRDGHAIGRLAVRLADKYQNPAFQNYTYHVFSLGINHWLEPLRSSYHYWHQASKLSLESGSPYAGWVFLQKPHLLFSAGAPLVEVAEQVKASEHYLQANKLDDVAQLLTIIVSQPLKHLLGQTQHFATLDDANFNTTELLHRYQDAPFFLGHTYYAQLRVDLLAQQYQSATQLMQRLAVIEATVQAQIIQVDSCWFVALQLSAPCHHLSGEAKAEHLGLLQQLIDKFAVWAQLCPHNFKHKYLLLQAEWLRLDGQTMAALDHYELAREAALAGQFLFDAALCDEFTGLFWLSLNKAYQAQSYLKRAMAGYEQWGAKAKVNWMKANYAGLSPELPSASGLFGTLDSTLGSHDFSTALDINTVLKASQAISQHINIDKLSDQLLSLAVENAGATRGLLLLRQADDYVIANENCAKQGGVLKVELAQSYSQSLSLSQGIVRFVINTKQLVLYSPKQHDEQFDRCPYLKKHKEVAIICVPIVRQNQLTGILYLENSHLAEAFMPERVYTLQILATQAAISLENAQMYRDLQGLNKNLEALVDERTQKLHHANQLLVEKNNELYLLSTTDQLTGIYNRRYMEEQLQASLTTLMLQPACVLMLDVDYFKQVNDNYGHDVGDDVLVNVANIIGRVIRRVDVAGRWGGEEFVILTMSDLAGAKANAERLAREVATHTHPTAGIVTVSIGVTPLCATDTLDSALVRVDKALYEAKNQGRNQVVVRTK